MGGVSDPDEIGVVGVCGVIGDEGVPIDENEACFANVKGANRFDARQDLFCCRV